MDFIEQAVIYCGMGFKIIPLRPGTKVAAIKNWPNSSSDDDAVISEWARQWPKANIGLLCGPDNNITALDIDKQHGGIETLKALVEKHGDLPRAPMSQTPRGGFHMLFAYDKRPMNGANRVGKGLDIKTKGGYIVAPPSFWDGKNKDKVELQGGGTYRWIRAPRGKHLPRMPGWLVKMATPPPPPRMKYNGPMGVAKGNEQIQGCMQRIATAASGNRNQTLNDGSLRAFQIALEIGIAPETIRQDLIQAGCSVETDVKQVIGTVNSALKGARKLHFTKKYVL